jgi:group I intron endonuclease
MKEHKHCALSKKMSNSLYKAVRKYGWDNFKLDVIANAPDQAAAQLLEESLIKQYDSVKFGYNDTYKGGGGNIYEGQPTKLKRFRKKMSGVTAGEKNGMFGRTQSDDAKELQRQKAKGRYSLQWFIDRHGPEEGTRLHAERSEKLRNRNLPRKEDGTFQRKTS